MIDRSIDLQKDVMIPLASAVQSMKFEAVQMLTDIRVDGGRLAIDINEKEADTNVGACRTCS